MVHARTSQHIDPLLLEASSPRSHPGAGRVDDSDLMAAARVITEPSRQYRQRLGTRPNHDGVGLGDAPLRDPLYALSMSHQSVNPALLEALIARCGRLFEAGVADPAAESAVLADLDAVREHLVIEEQRGLGEWIRDLPPHHLGDFLADMELTARQADADSDIGAFISALADWQTTADANRNGWERR